MPPTDTAVAWTAPPQALPATEAPAPIPTPRPAALATGTSEPAPTMTEGASGICRLGAGLRRDTVELHQAYPPDGRFIMVNSAGAADAYFPELEGAMRVLVAPSLAGLERVAQRADEAGVPYEALGYGLEQGRHTTPEELADLVAATQKAADLAERYGKLLVMGPGFRLMSEHWDDYPEMAALADVWVLQSQRLQVDPPGPAYRQEVERVIDQIRSGNPDISIWVQISVTPGPETVLGVDDWLAYRDSIADLADGVYVFDVRDPDRPATMERIFEAVCGWGT